MDSSWASRWVYLIGSSEIRPVKIGVTDNPVARLPTLQTGCPFPLSLIWTVQADSQLEAKLHDYFEPYHLRGEWFDFGDEDPVALVVSAATLMGYPCHPTRVPPEGLLLTRQAPAPVASVESKPTIVDHLVWAATVTKRGVATRAEVFAYLAGIDPGYSRTAEESDGQYGSRVGLRLAKALKAEGVEVLSVKVPTAQGGWSRGYRLADLQRARDTATANGGDKSTPTERRPRCLP